MMMSLELPADALFKVDEIVESLKRTTSPPTWPFRGSVKVRRLTPAERTQLREYEAANIIYQKALESGELGASRSYVISRIIRWAVGTGLFEEVL